MDLSAVQSLPDNQKQVLQTLANAFSYQNATAISIGRYNGAVEDGATNYTSLQLQAITKYTTERDQYLAALESQLTQMAPEMPSLNSSSIQAVQIYIKENGLPPLEKEVLNGLGLSSSISDITESLLLFNATTIGNLTLATGVSGFNSALMQETNVWNQTATVSIHQNPPISPANMLVVVVLVVLLIVIVAAIIVIRLKRRKINPSDKMASTPSGLNLFNQIFF